MWLTLEQSALGDALRRSPYLYPAANVAHILSLLVFFAAVAVMDARLLGALRCVPWRRIAGPCRPLAAAALTVQAASGLLLLVTDASALIANPAFRLKLATIALALANIAVLESLLRRRMTADDDAAPLPSGAGVCAAISLALWLATATLGRLIAYV